MLWPVEPCTGDAGCLSQGLFFSFRCRWPDLAGASASRNQGAAAGPGAEALRFCTPHLQPLHFHRTEIEDAWNITNLHPRTQLLQVLPYSWVQGEALAFFSHFKKRFSHARKWVFDPRPRAGAARRFPAAKPRSSPVPAPVARQPPRGRTPNKHQGPVPGWYRSCFIPPQLRCGTR